MEKQELTDEQIREKADRRQQAIRDFQEENFGRRYIGASLSKLGQNYCGNNETSKKLTAWLAKPRNFLVLLGPPGVGKTHFCAALTEWMFNRFDNRRYWKEEFLFARLRDAIREYSEYMGELRNCLDDQICVIDDIGSTPLNDWRKEIIFQVVDIRNGTCLPTVITSNLTKQQISDWYGERTMDRIFDKDNTIIEMFHLPSIRQEAY